MFSRPRISACWGAHHTIVLSQMRYGLPDSIPASAREFGLSPVTRERPPAKARLKFARLPTFIYFITFYPASMKPANYLEIDGSPGIPGLRFRHFSGDQDFPKLYKVVQECDKADGEDFLWGLEDFTRYYQHLANCDMYKDALVAEVDGEVIGYSRIWWTEKQQGGLNYNHFVNLSPKWRKTGILGAMFRWNESRSREIAASHPKDTPKSFQASTSELEHDWKALLESEGYARVRYSYVMRRPNLDNIPEIPLPAGLEVRPVKPEDYRKVWDADVDACTDCWEPIKVPEEWYLNWRHSHEFQPELWQVAWDGDKVAGAVQSYIREEENKLFNRKRGYTENIHVGRKWRGKGVAKALIARSFKVVKERGMEEACLGVDAENPTGALRLYESMGFRAYRTYYTYRKKM